MKKIVIATQNKGKLKEFKNQLKEQYNVVGLDDLGWETEIPEEADSLAGNAFIKARTIFEATGLACVSDDTGLLVEVLENRPGVYSARYAGENTTDQENYTKLIEELSNKTNRKAKFQTVLCFYNGKVARYFTGEVHGEITNKPKGENGFGYDPVFKPLDSEKTFAEITLEEKKKNSHRGRAIRNFLEFLKK